eukprot:3152067-Heterocapsa_arctica.AAC.1
MKEQSFPEDLYQCRKGKASRASGLPWAQGAPVFQLKEGQAKRHECNSDAVGAVACSECIPADKESAGQ